MQEAIPAASSTAKPRAEEAVSQGTASEPLAQECLRGNGNSWKTLEEKTQIQTGKDERHMWTDGMTVMNQLCIDICEYHRITEKCQSADGTILIDESSPKSVTYCATDVFWSKRVVFLLF